VKTICESVRTLEFQEMSKLSDKDIIIMNTEADVLTGYVTNFLSTKTFNSKYVLI